MHPCGCEAHRVTTKALPRPGVHACAASSHGELLETMRCAMTATYVLRSLLASHTAPLTSEGRTQRLGTWNPFSLCTMPCNQWLLGAGGHHRQRDQHTALLARTHCLSLVLSLIASGSTPGMRTRAVKHRCMQLKTVLLGTGSAPVRSPQAAQYLARARAKPPTRLKVQISHRNRLRDQSPKVPPVC